MLELHQHLHAVPEVLLESRLRVVISKTHCNLNPVPTDHKAVVEPAVEQPGDLLHQRGKATHTSRYLHQDEAGDSLLILRVVEDVEVAHPRDIAVSNDDVGDPARVAPERQPRTPVRSPHLHVLLRLDVLDRRDLRTTACTCINIITIM